MKVAAFLALTIGGAIGCIVTASIGATPSLVAASVVIAFGGVAGAAAAAAIDLNARADLKEAREAHGPTTKLEVQPLARGAFARLWLTALGALAAAGVVPLIALARRPGRVVRTGWRRGVRLVDENARLVTRDRLLAGSIETVFPEGGIALPESAAVLLRLSPELVDAEGAAAGASVDGYLAFSKICTHAGCPVALYREASHELYCPCHQSRFDVLRGAKNVSGPAPRPLPQLPIGVDVHGILIARGDFNAPVGPDDWYRTL